MRNTRLYVAALTLCLSAACGGDAPADSEPRPPERAPDTSVFTPLTDTLDRAEGVQSTVDEQAETLRRRIQEAEQ